jgi:succinate dehydrogenase cytochrome b subunit
MTAPAATPDRQRRSAPANPILALWRSTVGKKIVMATTGLIWAGFLVTHMAGNLLAFAGATKINEYSHFLHEAIEILWPARIVLAVAIVLHVTAAYQLTRVSSAARPIGYGQQEPQVSTTAARTIRWGGVLIFLFIVLHLLHFTFGTIHPMFNEGDPYGNLVVGLRVKWVAALYLVMMVVLGLHLYHGTWSAFRTLGVTPPSGHPLKRRIAGGFAIALWLGFTMVPLGVLLGIIR